MVDLYFTKLVDKKLEYPFNQCKLSANEAYRRENCIQVCISTLVAARYNCTFPGYFRTDNLPDCTDKSLLTISDSGCADRCPEMCHSKSYETSVLSKSMNAIYTSDQSINKRLLQVKSFYSSLSYIEFTQIPKTTLFDFISIIGGRISNLC